jgi:hypothetical protein
MWASLTSASRPRRLRRPWRGVAIIQDATRRLPNELRDDVAGDLTIALFEGTIGPEDVGAKLRELVTCHNCLFARRDVSMDAEIGEGGFTFGLIADPSSFDMEGTGHRVLTPQWASIIAVAGCCPFPGEPRLCGPRAS